MAMAHSAMKRDDESPRILLKLLGGEASRVSWDSLPERGRLPREEADDYIRLLDIHPSGTSYLSIDICIHKLSTTPGYTALSYVWGTDSKEFCQMDNLNSCLAHIGLHRPGLWWIDAICINQADTEEKNHQVAMMRYIYEKASRVYAWLGKALHHEWKVIQLFKRLETSLIIGQVKISRCKIRWDNPNLHEMNLEDVDSGVWVEMIAFFSKAYFSRTWVLQELMFEKSSKNVVFGCGQLECHASALWRSIHFLHSNEWIRAIHERHHVFGDLSWDESQIHNNKYQVLGSLRDWHNVHMHSKIVTSMHANGSISLRTLILATAEVDTREPRDKILALPGMTRVRNVSAYGIKVDYSPPVEDLYRDVTGCLTVKTQSYHLLVLSQEAPNKRVARLPSWVPDYSMPSSIVELGDSVTDANNLLAGPGSITWSQGSSSLGVKASIPDKVELVAENAMSGHTAKDLELWLHMLATYFRIDIKLIRYRLLHPFDEPELDIDSPIDKIIYYFLRILLEESSVMKGKMFRFAGMLFQDRVIDKGFVVSGWMNMMQLAQKMAEWGLLGQATWFQDHEKFLTTNVHGLRLFITKSGRAGLGPRSISNGDVMSQFHGRDVHYCLRPIGSGHYILLGRMVLNNRCLDGRLMKQGLDPTQVLEWQDIFLD